MCHCILLDHNMNHFTLIRSGNLWALRKNTLKHRIVMYTDWCAELSEIGWKMKGNKRHFVHNETF